MQAFALFDDAQTNRATLFTRLIRSEYLAPQDLAQLDACLKTGWKENLHAVLFADYEFGMPLQNLPGTNGTAAVYWFAEKQTLANPQNWLDRHGGEAPAGISTIQNTTNRNAYLNGIAEIKAAITRGDTYQINYTTRLHTRSYGNPVKLYKRLRQPVPYAVLSCLPDPENRPVWTLCFSPELFLHIAENGEIRTEPMKGTAPVLNDGQDGIRAQTLQTDPKNRAENIMIVDLLRNDLGKIARTGSVRVPEPFKVSRFGQVWQMTSAVYAQAKPHTSVSDIFRAAFPCGSITGAPKCMSMQLIDRLENEPRGLYTGSIGHLAPCESGLGFTGIFNVVIRTLQLSPSDHPDCHDAVYGVGSGIVWDSDADAEYAECGWKARFLNELTPEFGLIETMRVENRRCSLLNRHFKRLIQSAWMLNIPCNETILRSQIEMLISELPGQPARLKIILQPDGSLQHESAPLSDFTTMQSVVLSETILPDHDYLRRFKTTRRAVYDAGWQQAAAEGAFDCLFFNQSGELLEGGRSNVFIIKNGRCHTPPAASDLLNGVMRQYVLEHPHDFFGGIPVSEHRLTRRDVIQAERIFLCNALRGLFEVKLKQTMPV